MIARWIPVHGTHDSPLREGSWCHRDSALVAEFAEAGLHLFNPREPFVWSGDIDGVPWDRNADWMAGAAALRYYLSPVPFADRNIVAHSHGGAVALYAAIETPIRALITVGTPARKGVRAAGATALGRKNLGTWLHVYDPLDVWRTLGGLFDGEVRVSGAFGLPGMTDHRIRGIRHSRTLYDAGHAELRRQWLDILRSSPEAA